MAYGASIWHQPSEQPKGLVRDLGPKQSKCLRIALGAYKAMPVRSLETGLNVPPIDLYLTLVKAAFEKRLEATGMASYISQASQIVKTHLRKRGLYKQQ